MNEKTLYVSDLDGTLITSKERVSEYSISRLNALIEKGLPFTYATARSFSTAKQATLGLNCKLPIVVYNGALIVNPQTNEVVYQASFSEQAKQDLFSFLFHEGIYPIVYSRKDGKERLSWWKGKETNAMARYLSRRTTDERLCPCSSAEELMEGDVFYVNCMDSGERLYPVFERVKADPDFYGVYHQETYQSDFWLEISAVDATKEVAVRKLKEMMGFEKIVCFGDSENDIPMFKMADEKYAVENADEALKKYASGVVGLCEEDGVAKWLEEHCGSIFEDGN